MTWRDDTTKEQSYPSLEAWVCDWLAVTYRRNLDTSGRVWCKEWYEHREAVSRLTGAWSAYEALAVGDGGPGLSVFWRDHLDPCMDRLIADDGPFARCRHGHSERLPPLETGLSRAP